MKNNNSNTKLIDLNITSSIIFIVASIISLIVTLDERNRIINKKTLFNKKESLNIAFYNRIVILVSVFISLYVGYNNFKNEKDNTIGKYKSSLLLTTNILTVISGFIILYVAYLNRNEQTLDLDIVENPLV